MKRSDIKPMPEYFDRYINLVSDTPLIEALQLSLQALRQQDINRLENIGHETYAAGKWTIKEIMQHLIDVERIFCYRALLIARNDPTVPPGFDEKQLAGSAKANNRCLGEIMEELILVRQATIALFGSFDAEMLLRKGQNWKYEMSVLGFGFCLVGHQIWHFRAIAEKYGTH